MREALHVVGKIASEIDDCCAEAHLRADAAAAEFRLDEGREDVAGDLLKTHHRPCFIEGTPRTDHFFHEAWFGAREHVADLALLLSCGPQRMLYASAIESVNRLEFVKGHD